MLIEDDEADASLLLNELKELGNVSLLERAKIPAALIMCLQSRT